MSTHSSLAAKVLVFVDGQNLYKTCPTRVCDVAIIVSLDRDLYEIPQAV
ncbi:MAG TPA: hypothetical protein VIV12_17990 [Streptosporangiaceae bacterium]